MDLFENLNEIDIISDYDLYNEIDDLKNEIKQEGGNILDIINQNNGTENNMTFLKNLKEYNNYLINQLGGVLPLPLPSPAQTLISNSTSDQSHTEEKISGIVSNTITSVVPTIPHTNTIPSGTTIFVAEYSHTPSFEHKNQKFIHYPDKAKRHNIVNNVEIYNMTYDNYDYLKCQEYAIKGNLHVHEFKVNKNITNMAGVTDLAIINLHQAQEEYIGGIQETDPIKKKYEDLGHGTENFNGLIGSKVGEKSNIIIFTNKAVLDNLDYVKTHKIFPNGDIHSSVNLMTTGN